ncbi:MAG: FAD-binding protein [Deltaproteobacteria bacterium]|nr:FAD-binding protein [Deltaproteobacteria bacterium]
MKNDLPAKVIETDVLILGSGAAGCGAAIAANRKGIRVLMLDKGKLESSGNLGGGNDHFCAVLNRGPQTDSDEALVNFYVTPWCGLSPEIYDRGWAKKIPSVLSFLEDAGVEFLKNDDGTYYRTLGIGQPGNWWINIRNGHNIKRLLAKKIRSMNIDVMDHIMVTKIIKMDEKVSGCLGYNVLDGTFYIFRAKKVIMALGKVSTRGWTNSTGNPYNIWWSPYNTGSQFTLAYDAGVKLLNLDTEQRATLLPKGFGAPGMNGINSMGGHELNALGERFMGKYDPMWENGLRRNQILGTYQELIEGKGPPFFMDMTHLKKEDVTHLQFVLMPGDKATYLDYCEQKGIDFATSPLEVEISELSFGGQLLTRDNAETNISGIYNGCLFMSFSGAMCGGYYAGEQAAEASLQTGNAPVFDQAEVIRERKRIFSPMKKEGDLGYEEFESVIRQIMNYYMGYRRNQKGMEIALNKLNFLESQWQKIGAGNYHELMKTHESAELIKICQLTVRTCMERKESGRTFYTRTDYPETKPEFAKPLIIWNDGMEAKFTWGS